MTQKFYVYLLAMWLSWIHAACPVGPRHIHHRNNNFGKCITVNKGSFFHNRKLDYLFPLMRGWHFERDISALLLSHSLYTFFDIIEAWHGIACFIMLTSFKITLYSTQRPQGRKFSPLAGAGMRPRPPLFVKQLHHLFTSFVIRKGGIVERLPPVARCPRELAVSDKICRTD